jgi:hypothetical protein
MKIVDRKEVYSVAFLGHLIKSNESRTTMGNVAW